MTKGLQIYWVYRGGIWNERARHARASWVYTGASAAKMWLVICEDRQSRCGTLLVLFDRRFPSCMLAPEYYVTKNEVFKSQTFRSTVDLQRSCRCTTFAFAFGRWRRRVIFDGSVFEKIMAIIRVYKTTSSRRNVDFW